MFWTDRVTLNINVTRSVIELYNLESIDTSSAVKEETMQPHTMDHWRIGLPGYLLEINF